MQVPASIGKWLPLVKRPIRTIRRLSKAGGVILTYHRVADIEDDPHQLVVSPANFSQHLAYLKQTCRPMRLMDMIECLKNGGLPRRSVAITFDDGYVDNLEIAHPILEAAQIPATVYVASGYIDKSVEFWWDRLEQLLLCGGTVPSRLELRLRDRTDDWLTETIAERQLAFKEIHARLRPLSDAEREPVFSCLCEWSGRTLQVRPLYRPMTSDELKRLTHSGLIDLGAHTVTHPMLSTLSAAKQSAELKQSRAVLESIIGRPVDTCAFPYGQPEHFDDVSVAVAEENGFQAACTGVLGSVEVGDHPFLLQRGVVMNWQYDEFVRNVERYFIL
jgi:peptidoglycan/xylan/chitin deacetylase (PgdA/CDA1 family)